MGDYCRAVSALVELLYEVERIPSSTVPFSFKEKRELGKNQSTSNAHKFVL
jgi:hypothetical protein